MAIKRRPPPDPEEAPIPKRRKSPKKSSDKKHKLEIELGEKQAQFLTELTRLWNKKNKRETIEKILEDYRRGFKRGNVDISVIDSGGDVENLETLTSIAEQAEVINQQIELFRTSSAQEMLKRTSTSLFASGIKMESIGTAILDICLKSLQHAEDEREVLELKDVSFATKNISTILKDSQEAQLKAQGIDILLAERKLLAEMCDRLIKAVFGEEEIKNLTQEAKRDRLLQIVSHVEKMRNPGATEVLKENSSFEAEFEEIESIENLEELESDEDDRI